MSADRYVLLLSCPDAKGIVASVAGVIYQLGGNIQDSIQHHDQESDTFFMRVAWQVDADSLCTLNNGSMPTNSLAISLIQKKLQPLAQKYRLGYTLASLTKRPKVAIMVSKQLHCVHDLLLQQREGQLPCQVTSVISNHQDAKPVVKWFGVPFHYTPVNTNIEYTESQQLDILRQEEVETVVLARYMRILSADFVSQYTNNIINIHHSFLPAFVGAKPYHQAFARGVKIVGATSHYVTAELDQGPIIEQGVTRISHRDSVDEIIRKGKDLERNVLTQALRLHLQHRVLVYGHKTIIFT